MPGIQALSSLQIVEKTLQTDISADMMFVLANNRNITLLEY